LPPNSHSFIALLPTIGEWKNERLKSRVNFTVVSMKISNFAPLYWLKNGCQSKDSFMGKGKIGKKRLHNP